MRGVRLLIVTATRRGPVVEAAQRLLADAAIEAGEVTVLGRTPTSQYRRIPLWDVERKPPGWESLKVLEQACHGAKLMVEWLWLYKKAERGDHLLRCWRKGG